MPTDLTGAPTSLGIGTYNVDADAPSGLGFNAAMAQIDALIAARVSKPAGVVSGEVPVWNGTGWDRSSVTRIGPASLGSGTPSGGVVLHGDGTWGAVKYTDTALDASGFAGASFAAHAASVTTLTNGVSAKINMDSVDSDPGGNYSTANKRFTAPVKGLYFFFAQIDIPPTYPSGNRFILAITKNGVTVGAITFVKNGVTYEEYPQAAVFSVANATDYFEVVATQDGAASVNVNNGAGSTYWGGTLLGRLS